MLGKKTLCKVLAISVTFSIFGSTIVKAEPISNYNINKETISSEWNQKSLASWGTDWVKSKLWYFAGKASSAWFNTPGVSNVYSSVVRRNSGSISLNSGNNGASIRIDIPVSLDSSKTGDIDIFGSTHPLNLFGNVSVLLTTKNGADSDVINRTVGHNQHSYYTLSKGKKENYRARLTCNNSNKWDFYTVVREYSSRDIQSTSKVKSLSTENEVFADIEDGQVYLRASKGFKTINKISKTLNFTDLGEQFYDENSKSYVSELKGFNSDDKVIIKDTLIGIRYDKVENATFFKYFIDNQEQEIAFAGDLTDRYKAGDVMSFNFKVVNETING